MDNYLNLSLLLSLFCKIIIKMFLHKDYSIMDLKFLILLIHLINLLNEHFQNLIIL